jgi:hypothetical protein
MDDVGIFYDNWVCFTALWHILCPFSTFCIRLVHFSGLGIMYQEKSGNPARNWNFSCTCTRHFSNLLCDYKDCVWTLRCEKYRLNSFTFLLTKIYSKPLVSFYYRICTYVVTSLTIFVTKINGYFNFLAVLRS